MSNPFERERDPVLGAALREALTPADTASFTSRVLASLGSPRNSWDVLASWARPGVAAAVLLVSLLGYWLVRDANRGPAPLASELLASDQTFDGGKALDVVMGSRR
ncbi:MAG TPA: hypothetical protein VG817_01480 [Gemmatimonadales bacterium]|nr:hypothetical protein [Gemmatimonadales bacterium]